MDDSEVQQLNSFIMCDAYHKSTCKLHSGLPLSSQLTYLRHITSLWEQEILVIKPFPPAIDT